MKSARPINNQWQNTTGQTIFIIAHFVGVAGQTSTFDVLENPGTGDVWKSIVKLATATAGTATQAQVCIPIKEGHYYRLLGNATVNWWWEFRP